MSNHDYYGGSHRAPYPRDYPHSQTGYPRHQAPLHPGALPYRGYPEHEVALRSRERMRVPYQSPARSYDPPPSASISQPRVIDYANKHVPVERPRYEDDYGSAKPSPVVSTPAQETPAASFGGALSKISLTELKNTLGGQLGNLLSKGLAQPSLPSDAPRASQEQVQRERLPEDRRYEIGNSQTYHGERKEYPSAAEREYTSMDVRHKETSGYHPPIDHGQQAGDHLRKPLFPIASASEEAPKSILKKSILKKSDTPAQKSQISQSTSVEPVDEDAFLYGSGPSVDPPLKNDPELLQDAKVPATEPDTQKIISNPAFTALLKSIGLPDINMAEKVKEKQQLTEKQRSQAQRVVTQQHASAGQEDTFGIDQTASFLSSEVVLDDLLKLKQPSKEHISKMDQGSAYADRHFEKESYKKDVRSYDKDQWTRNSSDQRREDDRSKGSSKFDDQASSRRRSNSPNRYSPRRRSRSPRRRSRSPRRRSPRHRSPRRRSRSPRRYSRSPRRYSRSPKRYSRSPKRRSRSPRRDRSRSPYRKSAAPSDKEKVYNRSPSRKVLKEDVSVRIKGKWTEVAMPANNRSPPRKQEITLDERRELSVGTELEHASRKRILNSEEAVPPLKSMKEEVEEGFHDLLSKIPRDVKLTRAQFEGLMKAHQAKQEAAARERQFRASPPREMKRHSPNISPARSSSVTRKVISDDFGGEMFTNLTMVVRSDNSKPQSKTITDDDLLGVKKPELPAPVKRSSSPAIVTDESEGRRVVKRIGAIGNAALEKRAIESEKDKYLREFEKVELEKAFGKEPLLPRLSGQEIKHIRQIIEFNREKLLGAEQQLSALQNTQSDVMKNLRRASVGEQYHLDKTLEQNIRLQNNLSAEIKNLKKLIREDELSLDEQFEQERKIREISRKKAAVAKAVDSRSVPVKDESPPPEKQDRKYRRAMEDKMMGKQITASVEPPTVEGSSKLPVSKPGTTMVQYYDPGTHWCKSCNFVAFKLNGYLEHMQSSSHMKRRHKIGKPWQPEEVVKPPRKSLVSRQETIVQPMKGIEFIHPVDSFYCLLCNFFTGDKDSIEYHLKSTDHHKQYETYITDNPMYEKRYKVDKERGLQEAKKLEEKRQEEQERLREAEREELERRREAERKKERELKEAEEKRKKAKVESLKAKKKAEVLAITRGSQDDSDIEEVIVEEGPVPPPTNETPQERIKRALLEKTRAKKAAGSSTEEPGVMAGETVVQRGIRLAKEAKTMQDRVRAKAAEIEQSVYGPKQPVDTPEPSGVFLPEPTHDTKSKTPDAGSVAKGNKAANVTSTDDKAKPPPPSTSSSSSPAAPSLTGTAQSAATANQPPPPSTTASAISPFVQKMMEMEKSGEIITTAAVKAQQAAAVTPQMMPNNQTYRQMQPGSMGMGPMAAPMSAPMTASMSAPMTAMAAPMTAPMAVPMQRAMPPVTPMGPRMAMQPAARPMAMNMMGTAGPMAVQPNPGPMGPQLNPGPMGPQLNPGPMGPQRNPGPMGPRPNPGPMGPQPNSGPMAPMRVMNRPAMRQPMMGNMGPPRVVPNRMMGPMANTWREPMQARPMAPRMMSPRMVPHSSSSHSSAPVKETRSVESEEENIDLRPPGTDDEVELPPGTEEQTSVKKNKEGAVATSHSTTSSAPSSHVSSASKTEMPSSSTVGDTVPQNISSDASATVETTSELSSHPAVGSSGSVNNTADSSAISSVGDGSAADSSVQDISAADSSTVPETSSDAAQPECSSVNTAAGDLVVAVGATESFSFDKGSESTGSPAATTETRHFENQQIEVEQESVEDMTFTVIDSVGDEDEKA